MAEIQHWQMWRERCALARCPQGARHDLCGFAFDRFRHYLQKVTPSIPPPRAHDAWHAFESHLALGRTRSAKAWKQWLFARGGSPPTLNCIQGGATLIMRGVVRDHLRREHAPGWMLSLDGPVLHRTEPGSNALSLEELLPDPGDPLAAIEQQDIQTCANRLFPAVYGDLSPRERIALTIHQAGKALSDPSVTQAAQCGKSSLCNALCQAMQRMAHALQDALPQESTSTRIAVACILIEKSAENMRFTLEMEHPELFRYIKGDA